MFTLNIYISKKANMLYSDCTQFHSLPSLLCNFRMSKERQSCTIHGLVLFIWMRTIFNSGFVVFCPGYRWWRDLCWTVVAASAVSDDGRPVGSGCWCFSAMDVHGGVSHHAPSHVWALAWSHRGLHPDPGQNLGGGERKHFFQCISTE